MKKLKALLKDRHGSGFPLIIAVTLALLLLFCGISEYMRLMIIASGVRNAVQTAVVATVNDNYNNVYQGAREGYSGGYQPSGSSWASSVDYGDIYAGLDETLGTQSNGGNHIKYAGSSVEYEISGLSVTIRNAPLAPSNPSSSQKFLADASITLDVPVSFVGKVLPPMRITVKTEAQYTPKF
jgi:hypothetical protein